MTVEDIENTFKSARQAYRFLHEFQVRLRDTIERFRQEFDGFTYYASGPIHTDKPTFRQSPHQQDKWCLDLFPAYAYSMRYQSVSDTGKTALLEICFWCDENYDGEHDSLPPESEDSSTAFEVYFWEFNAVRDEKFVWKDLWNNHDYPEVGEIARHSDTNLNIVAIPIKNSELETEEKIVKEAIRIKNEIVKKLNYDFD